MLRDLDVQAALPPMDLTCLDVFRHRVAHACLSAPPPASDVAFYLRLSPLLADSKWLKGREEGGERRQCFMVQAFAMVTGLGAPDMATITATDFDAWLSCEFPAACDGNAAPVVVPNAPNAAPRAPRRSAAESCSRPSASFECRI